jgi:lipopolysaccharide biosynthesis glycosyltransferase
MRAVAYCADNSEYLRRAAVSALSLHAVSPGLFERVYFLIPHELNHLFFTLTSRMPSELATRVRAIDLDSRALSGLFVDKWASSATYGRLLLPELVEENVAFLLYVDADTMFVDEVSELALVCPLLAITGLPFAAVAHTNLDLVDQVRLARIGVDPRSHLSAGVLLINVKQWRSQEISKRALEIVRRMGNRLQYWDQDALNILQGSQYFLLAGRYNNLWYESLSNPAIIHYAGPNKPSWRPAAFPADDKHWEYWRSTLSSGERIFLEIARYLRRFQLSM